MKQTDLLIIGAGPAGMAAAELASALGLSVMVVDEQAARGGQFLRQPPSGFTLSNWLPGKTYRKAKQLLAQSEKLVNVEWLFQATVSGAFPINHARADDARFRVVIDKGQGGQHCDARSVLVATGCYDLPVIFPGWNTPGVMAAGGIQAFIKSQQLVPGKRFVLSGSHPLQLVIADQIVKAGGEVAAVLFTQSQSAGWSLLKQPMTLRRHSDKFAQMAGIMLRLRNAGVPVKFGQTVTAANGNDELESVTIAPLNAAGKILHEQSSTIACDRLGICFSFLSSSELLRQLGADCVWNARRGGWIAGHDRWMRSSIPGIYVAGETTGVAGSDAAMDAGRLAAVGCALEHGKLETVAAEQASLATRRSLHRREQFAELLSEMSWPGDAFFDQLMTETSTLCKCEELSVGELRQALQDNPDLSTASGVKLLSRAGMGLCQGRYCHHALTRLLAQTRGVAEQQAAGFTSRFPAKPVTIAHLLD